MSFCVFVVMRIGAILAHNWCFEAIIVVGCKLKR